MTSNHTQIACSSPWLLTGDPQVQAMYRLLSVTSDPADKQTIQAEIDKRLALLK